MAGPWIMPAMMAATEMAGPMMAAAAPAAAGAAGLGAAGAGLGAAGAGLGAAGAGLGAMTPGVLTAANGMIIPTGVTPSVMGALGAGDAGMASTLAGNAMQRGIAGLISPFKMVNPQTLEPMFGSKLMSGMRGANMARQGINMMQGGGQGQPPPRSAPRVPPVQMGSPPQMAQRMPTPAELAAYRRVKWRTGDQGGRALA
jgi:hypothetical protein